MSALEILLVITSIFTVIGVLKKHNSSKFLLIACGLIILISVVLGQARWQLYPLYVALAITALVYFLKPNTKLLAKVGLVFSMLAILISAILAYALPIVDFPAPTGKFTVGIKNLYFQNEDNRKLTVKAWYPSNSKTLQPKSYYNNGYSDAFAMSKGFPAFLFSHVNNTKTHSQKDLHLFAEDKLPIVIFSHGYLWNAELYTSIIEDLASNGYIVFGIDHTFETPLTKFKNEDIYWKQELMDSMYHNLDFGKYKSLEEQFLATKNKDEKLQIMKEMMSVMTYSESLNRWSKDIAFVINQLKQDSNNPKSFWYNKIDTQHIGLIGHSWGGASVVQNSAEYNDAKAVVNLDGAQWGNLINHKLNTPLLAMYADRDYNTFFTPNFFVYNQVCTNDLYQVIVKDSDHANFGDLSYWFNINGSLTEIGSINPERMTTLTNTMILEFLDHYLKGKTNNLEQKFSDTNIYPELEFKKLK